MNCTITLIKLWKATTVLSSRIKPFEFYINKSSHTVNKFNLTFLTCCVHRPQQFFVALGRKRSLAGKRVS